MSPLLPTLLVALTGATLGAVPKPSVVPAGIVVEKVLRGLEASKAGIQPGDVLISWERAANPPSNPSAASGLFRSPFDVTEVYIEQSPRARTMTLGVLRAGKRLSISILQLPWGLESRPQFSPRLLQLYEKGLKPSGSGDLETRWAAWRSLAAELSSAGDRLDSAWVRTCLALGQSIAKQTDRALATLDEALTEAAVGRRHDVEAQLWNLKARVLLAANRGADARKAGLRALSIREGIDPEGLGVAHGLGLPMDPEDPEFEPIVRRSLGIAEKLAPNSRVEADSLSDLGVSLGVGGDSVGETALALRAFAIYERLDPASAEAGIALSNLCAAQAARGELAVAEEYCRRSLAVQRKRDPGEGRGVAISLHNAAFVARLRGEIDRSKELYLRALAIRERVEPVSRGMSTNLVELGDIEVRRGNFDRADEFFRRAGEVGMVTDPAYSPQAADLARRRAEIAYRRGDLDGAEALLREAVGFYEQWTPDGFRGAAPLDQLGFVLAARGLVREAEERLRRALLLRRRFAPRSRDTAESNHNLGMLLWKVRRLDEAEGALRTAIDDLESQRAKVGDSGEAWSVFAAEFADYYRDYAELLMERHREQDAFLILERLRAGAFLRMLAQRDLAAPEDVPADLLREQRRMNAEYERVQSAIRVLNAKDDAKDIDDRLAQLEELRQRRAEVTERIKKASPRYAALQHPQPLGLAATMANLDPGTLLLSYSIGKEKSFLFAVSSDGKRGPPLSVFELPVGEKTIRASVEAMRRLIAWNEPSPDLLARSHGLYEMLLKPAEALIGRSKRLVIVPDGPLNILPWASLVRETNGAETRYLVEWKPVHIVVSATVYAELKKGRRDGMRSAEVELAAFGDPRYPAIPGSEPSVERGDGTEEALEESYGDPEIDAVTRGGYRFRPLPRSRQEVETIASLYAPNAETFLGERATEDRARSVGKDVSLIHYACHAYVNERFPLDSALVFTIPENPKDGQGNGLLQAWEIFEKVRIDADLVTLSACDSGLGKEMGGEGLIGLTRAFQYAGARTVLASLWKVEDASTAELMKRFYGYLKAGRTKDEALRLAQIDLIRSPNYAQPRDWAAFELMGDWK